MSDKNKNSDDESKSEDEGLKNKTLAERTSLFEWIVAALGACLVLFSIGFITYEAIFVKDTPPDLLVKVTSTTRISSGYLVEFKVKNEGEKTAASVSIEGKLKNSGGEEIETKTTTIEYVAAKSERSGGLIYKENPETNKLEISAVGYKNP